jgi:hypothetical protein
MRGSTANSTSTGATSDDLDYGADLMGVGSERASSSNGGDFDLGEWDDSETGVRIGT